MITTNALYKSIYDDPNHWTEIKVDIAGTEYGEDNILSLSVSDNLLGDSLLVGGVCASELDIDLCNITEVIPRNASITVYFRLKNAEKTSDWYCKGKYYIDTRQSGPEGFINAHGYDSMLKSDKPFTATTWSNQTLRSVAGTCGQMIGCPLLNASDIPQNTVSAPPLEMTIREVLSNIAIAAGGNFAIRVVNGAERLVFIGKENVDSTYFIVGNDLTPITFGGVRIIWQ